MNTKSKKMTGNQRNSIFAYYNRLGIHDTARRHDIQLSITGVESLTKFTTANATKLIQHLKGLNGEDPKAGFTEHASRVPRAPWTPAEGSKTDPATTEQIEMLRTMLEGMGATASQRGKWVIRQTRNTHAGPTAFPRTVGEAQKLIRAALAMQQTGYRFDKPKTQHEAHEGQ